MFGIDEMSSLTWDSAAWIYSVIIGVVLARYFIFIANLLQEPKAIKFYYPYISFVIANILFLYLSWYTGKQSYTVLEGKTLVFAIRSFLDAISCIAGLMIVPQDQLLAGFFDMKSWFMRIKRAYFFVMVLYFLVMEMYMVLSSIYTPEVVTTETLIGFSGAAVIVIFLHVVSAFSKNGYYLSLHGTLMVVMSSFQ